MDTPTVSQPPLPARGSEQHLSTQTSPYLACCKIFSACHLFVGQECQPTDQITHPALTSRILQQSRWKITHRPNFCLNQQCHIYFISLRSCTNVGAYLLSASPIHPLFIFNPTPASTPAQSCHNLQAWSRCNLHTHHLFIHNMLPPFPCTPSS